MPNFDYTARDESLAPRSGQIVAADAADARQQLAAQGLEIEQLSEASEPFKTAWTAGLFHGERDAIELCNQVATLAAAQIPLASGLRALAEELPPGRQARQFAALAAALERGAKLEDAVRAPTARLPGYVQALLTVGMQSGRIGEVLQACLQQQRDRSEMRRALRGAFGYPALLLALLGVWVGLILLVLAPPLMKTISDFEIELPPLTQGVVWLVDHGALLITGATIFLVGGAVLIGVLRTTPWGGRLLGGIPAIGACWRYSHTANFVSLLAVLLDHRVPLPEALRLAGAAVADGALAAAARDSALAVANGAKLEDALSRPGVPPTLLPIVGWGERLSALPEALRSAADYFHRRSQLRADLLRSVLPPLVFILIGLSVLLVINGLFSPLIKLISSLT